MVENNQTKSSGRGGRREGAGRPAGSANRRTRDIADALVADGGLTPVDYLMGLMRDEEADQKVRFNAAVAAAPYVHPRMQAVTVSGDPDNPFSFNLNVNFVAPNGKSS